MVLCSIYLQNTKYDILLKNLGLGCTFHVPSLLHFQYGLGWSPNYGPKAYSIRPVTCFKNKSYLPFFFLKTNIVVELLATY